MENQVQIFNNPDFGTVRTVLIDGVPYFVGKDVADALGYTNPQKAIRDHVDDEDKRTEQIVHPFGGAQNTVVINESGLYSLILSSKLPRAKEFKRWVTAEVLPSIRKYGVYATPDVAAQLLNDPAFAVKIFTALADERAKTARLTEENKVLHEQVFEMKPKANYYDLILQCPHAIPVTVIAKDYGLSAKKFNKLLNKLGVQFKVNGTWVLYSKYADRGWTVTKTHNYIHKSTNLPDAAVNTYWTQKGRRELYELLKANGYLPKIEQDLFRLPEDDLDLCDYENLPLWF